METSKLFPVKCLYQNDDWNFSLSLSDYDASIYTITYVFKKAGADSFSIVTPTNANGTFTFSVPAATTAAYTPGLYYVIAVLTSTITSQRLTLGQTEIQIKPDMLTYAGDPRSLYRIALDEVEAALASGAGSDVQEYTIGGRTVKKNRAGLLELRSFYLQRVRVEDGKSNIGSIYYNL